MEALEIYQEENMRILEHEEEFGKEVMNGLCGTRSPHTNTYQIHIYM